MTKNNMISGLLFKIIKLISKNMGSPMPNLKNKKNVAITFSDFLPTYSLYV